MAENTILQRLLEKKESLRRFAEEITGWQVKDTNIKTIKVMHFSDRMKKRVFSDICIGKELDENLSNVPHEPVVGIFESNDYHLVVTPNRNNLKGTVYFFEQENIINIERGK